MAPSHPGLRRRCGRRPLLRHLCVGALVAVSGLACSPSAIPEGFLLGGIQVNEPDMDVWHRALTDNSFNTLSLTVYARQGPWDGPRIEFDPDALGGDTVREIRAAKRAGLEVVLILRVALDHAFPENRFLWHGLIQPVADDDLDAWFFRYGEFVRRWAEVAEAEGVDLFGIGSELSSLTSTLGRAGLPDLERYYLDAEAQEAERRKVMSTLGEAAPQDLRAGWGDAYEGVGELIDARAAAQARWARRVTFEGDLERLSQRRRRLEENWRRLIREVRTVYSGPLTYAANFDQFDQVGFWDALDVVGVNAYFPLREDLRVSADGLRSDFRESWRGILDRIAAVRERQHPGAPVVFTELGYTRWRGSTIQPWAGDGFAVVGGADGVSRMVVWRDQPLDPMERVEAVQALADVVVEFPGLLRGLLWWKLSTLPGHHDVEPFLLVLDPESPDPLRGALERLAGRATS